MRMIHALREFVALESAGGRLLALLALNRSGVALAFFIPLRALLARTSPAR